MGAVLNLRPHGSPGRLVTFSGVDGSGKTTLLEAAGDFLRERGARVFQTRMPGKSAREHPLLRQFMYDPDPARRAAVDFLAVSLIVMADRLQHLKEEVLPRLADGQFVLCDRYVFQALVFARIADEPEDELAAIAARFPAPDLALFLDVPTEVALARLRQREKDRGRFLDVEGFARQTTAYREIAAEAGAVSLPTGDTVARAFAALAPRLAELTA